MGKRDKLNAVYPIKIDESVDSRMKQGAVVYAGPVTKSLMIAGVMTQSDQEFAECALISLAASHLMTLNQVHTALNAGIPQEEIDRYLAHAKATADRRAAELKEQDNLREALDAENLDETQPTI